MVVRYQVAQDRARGEGGGRTYSIAHGVPDLHSWPQRMDVIVPNEQLAPTVLPRALDTAVVGGDDGLGRVLACKPSTGPGGTRVQDNCGDFICEGLAEAAHGGGRESWDVPPPYSTVEGAWFEERVGCRLDIIAGEYSGGGQIEGRAGRGGGRRGIRRGAEGQRGRGGPAPRCCGKRDSGGRRLGPPLWC